MKKPLIALTPSHDTKTNDIRMPPAYPQVLQAFGAIPIVLPLNHTLEDINRIADAFDGFLFTGGPDVHPFQFHEEAHINCGAISPERDELEIRLLHAVLAKRKPILGICRGIQIINIGLGGTIWQDIPSQVSREFSIAHSQAFRHDIASHYVTVIPNSLLYAITGKDHLSVNSMHHQAVHSPAPALSPAAYSSDRLIEALEMKDYPFLLALQWHPEYLWPNDAASSKLFEAFVDSCLLLR